MIYLLQRGTINRPFVLDTLSTAVHLDYMGSSEFEWGALPKSLRAMEEASASLRLVRFPEIRQEGGGELIGYGIFPEETATAYATALKGVSERKVRCKEWTNLPEAMQPNKYPIYVTTAKERGEYRERMTSFWWDIQNHVMLSFDAAFMQKLPEVLAGSWAVMNAKKADSSATAAPAQTEPAKYSDQVDTQAGGPSPDQTYHGRVVALLQNKASVVHSYLIEFAGGQIGRLPVTRLLGRSPSGANRQLRRNNTVYVRVSHTNPANGRIGLTEATSDRD